MILVTAATEFEMNALIKQVGLPENLYRQLVTGVGLAQTAQNLTHFLCKNTSPVDAVLNYGVGGAYFQPQETMEQPGLLDICVAEREVFGDLGICMGDAIEYLDKDLVGPIEFDLKTPIYASCIKLLESSQTEFYRGTFISVNSATGRRARGDMLQRKWGGLCENMEGAAVAQVCRVFSLQLFELRCVSNMVEDRNPDGWRIREACEKAAITVKNIIEGLA
ncbi:MAG: futalosine hydrolase [Desulforhopalus sp.]|jgi:futalosine hydrolase